jgi:hypothetical protein
MKKVLVTLTSTNDLAFPHYPFIVQFVSLSVQVLQLTMLILLIHNNIRGIPKHQSLEFRVGQTFVFLYLVAVSSTGFSVLYKAGMAACNDGPQLSCRIFGSDPQMVQCLKRTWLK